MTSISHRDDRPAPSRGRIILIDDDPEFREATQKTLEREYEVHGFFRAEPALERLAEIAPDLIVCDIRLPALSGVDLLRKVKSSPETRSIPILLLTANDDREERLQALELGASDCLVKPFSPRELIARVSTQVELSRLKQLAVEQEHELRLRAEQVAASHATLAALFESSDDAILGINLDGLITSWNPGAQQIFGFTADDSIGKPITILSPPDRTDDWPRLLQAVKQGKRVQHFETVRQRKDGNKIYVSLSVSPVRGADNKLKGLAKIARDITPKVLAEKAIREEAAFRKAVESSIPCGIAACDLAGKQIYVNPAFCKMVGWEEADLLGSKPPFPYWPPEEREMIEHALHRTLAGQAPAEGFELRFARKDGTRFDAHLIPSPFHDATGTVLGWLASVTDVTERKLSEHELVQRHVQLQLLYQLVEEVNRAESTWEIADAALDAMIQLMHLEGAALLLKEPSGDLKLLCWRGLTQELRSALEKGAPQLVESGADALACIPYEKIPPEIREQLKKASQHEISYLPLWHQDQPLGYFLVFHSSFQLVNREQNRLARTIANQVAFALGRRRAQAALEASEEEFRAMFELAGVGKAQADTQTGRFLRVNRKLCEMTGYTPAEMQGLSFQEITHPDDRPNFVRIFQQLIEGLIHDFSLENRYLRKDGSVLWVHANGALVRDQTGRPLRTLAVIQDISDRKRREAERIQLLGQLELERSRLEVLLQYMPAGVLVAEAPSGRLIFANKQCETILGQPLPVPNSIDEYAAWMMFHSDRRPYALHELPLTRALQKGEIIRDEELIVRRPDGTEVTISASAAPIFNREGRITFAVASLHDITEHAQLFQEAQQARAEAEAANKAKDQFLAVLSHELRTPLTPILMSVSLLSRRKDLPKPVHSTIELITRNIQLEARLIDDLLDLSRITHKKMELATEPTNLHEVLERALNVCRNEIELKNHTLNLVLHAENSSVLGDPRRLEQVFWNLIKNAVKFTPAAGQLEVRSRNIAGAVCVDVCDSGIGIDQFLIPRIFEPFEQGGEKIVTQFGGLGLGLAISKAIVEAHGGKLTATSSGHNKGAVFSVELPLIEVAIPQRI